MRKKVHIQTVSESSGATDVWIQHLVNRLIIEQLNVPHRLQAKLLYETLPKKQTR